MGFFLNYLVRKGFAPAAATNVILAYRDTVDLVQSDAGGYDSAPATTEQAGNMQPAQQTHHASTSAGAILIKQGDERIIGMYDFEDGSRVKIVASGEAPTESVLDMVETLIELKRKEIARRSCVDEIDISVDPAYAAEIRNTSPMRTR